MISAVPPRKNHWTISRQPRSAPRRFLGFRDLRDDSLSALEKEKSIRRFANMALAQGLRRWWLSASGQGAAFGVLLLGRR